MTDAEKISIIRDPTLVKNRVFVGNLPVCTREELESICYPYGNKVLGSMVQKNFGFVQFESEEIANKVASALTKSTFKGNIITVRNAGSKNPTTVKRTIMEGTQPAGVVTNSQRGQIISGSNTGNIANDCELIVVDRKNTKYAEYIEERLKNNNMRCDVLYPNNDVPLGKVLANIALRGCLYAVLVTNQHQEHHSITVNILYGQPAEHRNMPIEDAIKFIVKDFHNKLARDGIAPDIYMPQSSAVAVPTTTSLSIPQANDKHPEGIQMLLNCLADNLPLTIVQYDRIIKYIEERREIQLKLEQGNTIDAPKAADPEIELQKKINNILSKPSMAEKRQNLLYPTLDSVKNDNELMDLLKDVRVQKALESLMHSKLVNIVESYMKF